MCLERKRSTFTLSALPAFPCLQVKIAKALALHEQQQRKHNLTQPYLNTCTLLSLLFVLHAFLCLQVKIAEALALREQAQRKRNLTKYMRYTA
jgi:hypothetical protein